MSIRLTLAAAAAVVITASSAACAATTYDELSHTEGGTAEHSLWFSGSSNPSGASGTEANHFLFENSVAGVGSFSVSGMFATLTGTVLNAAGQGFDMILNLVEVADPGTYKNPFGDDRDDWVYYGLDGSQASTLTSLTAGISSFDISLRGAPLVGQFGTGANDKNSGLLGFSTWITLTESGECHYYYDCQSYAGDINILLEDNGGGGGGVIPLPASIFLLPAAFGMLGAVGARRRRRKS